MRAALICVGLLALSAIASASCPNQCSGHGRCNANDKCECYTQVNTPWGNRFMYTGADCSLRTCPLGSAPDGIANYNEGVGPLALTAQGTSRPDADTALHVYLSDNLMLAGPVVTINVKVATYSSGTDLGTFVWKYASDPATYYSQPISFKARAVGAAGFDNTDVMLLDPPSALGQYPTNLQTETGIRIYFDDSDDIYVGDEYTVTITRPSGYHWVGSNDNTLHQGAECSRRGICDTTTGKCKCFTGFGGEACQRTTCPNDCSGHGTCQDEYHFRADADATSITSESRYGSIANLYTDAFDAQRQMGCKCDQGYRGPDCSLIECPSGSDPLVTSSTEEADQTARDCSGRGICDYSVGQCKCFKGYYGERCESQTNFV